ncbi:kinase-like domain-containing protein [Mycena latifolia]|nr:kinase-like domain-containing protein [Mycena latifolia]
MLGKNELARNDDMNVLNARLKALEQNQVYLQETLEIKQDNMIAMMACIQRRLDGQQQINPPEKKFYSHTLQYLTSMSGQQVKLEDWMIVSFDVDFGTEIGVGGFGKVYRGTWNRTDVAIKVLHSVAGATSSLVLLRQEINIWLTLRHPNILQFLGANTLDDTPFIVMPYIPNNARQFLKKHPDFDPVYILRDISLGLQYLHSRKICHGDIKGINILVEDSGRSLLCDFGLSRVKADITTRTAEPETVLAGSRSWMAPELLAGSLPKMPSDIYAFGMTMYELYTDETPLATVSHTDFIELVFRLGVRPTRPDINDVPRLIDPLWNLAELCWLQSAKERPTAGEIHDKIVDMISQMPRDIPQAAQYGRNTSGKPDKVSEGSSIEPEEGHPDLEKATRLNSDFLANKKALGEDHPDTLLTMAELVHILPGLGRAKEAEELGVTAIKKMKQVLGEDHPHTLRTLGNLARTYSDLGRPKEAEEIGVTAIRKMKKVLGEDHHETLLTMGNLASTYSNSGQFKEAKELQVTVIKKQKQVLGEDHPDTLLTMGNLASTYSNSGQFKEAKELQVTVIKKQKQVLGEGHPDTLLTMGNLASTYSKLGQFKEAKELEEMVMKRQKQVLGEDHPDTLLTMGNLANTYLKLGKSNEAEELAVVATEKQKQVLGPAHPYTLWTMETLVRIRTYKKQGNSAKSTRFQSLSDTLSKIKIYQKTNGSA